MSDCQTTHQSGVTPDRDPAGPTRVFVVDDHAGYRSVAAAVIDATPGFVLVGSSANADDAIESVLAVSPPPDLILMDINLGERSGVEVTASVTEALPELSVIFVSALGADELPLGVRDCGAHGYFPKVTLSPTVLEDAWAGAYDWRP